jgi:hypothetical protein
MNHVLGALCKWGKLIFLKSTQNSASFDNKIVQNVGKGINPYVLYLYTVWLKTVMAIPMKVSWKNKKRITQLAQKLLAFLFSIFFKGSQKKST